MSVFKILMINDIFMPSVINNQSASFHVLIQSLQAGHHGKEMNSSHVGGHRGGQEFFFLQSTD